jgi:pimeloyl-ACP methyl ester carboxylesterase
LDQLDDPALPKKAVLVGDSQGGFGALRAAHIDVKEGKRRIAGVVAIGSSADAEDKGFSFVFFSLSRIHGQERRGLLIVLFL